MRANSKKGRKSVQLTSHLAQRRGLLRARSFLVFIPLFRGARADLRRQTEASVGANLRRLSYLFSATRKKAPCRAPAWRREEDYFAQEAFSFSSRSFAALVPTLDDKQKPRSGRTYVVSPTSSLRHAKRRPVGRPRGAEKRIRTSGRFTTVTRFPIALLKPLRHLCVSFLESTSYFTRIPRKRQPFSASFAHFSKILFIRQMPRRRRGRCAARPLRHSAPLPYGSSPHGGDILRRPHIRPRKPFPPKSGH